MRSKSTWLLISLLGLVLGACGSDSDSGEDECTKANGSCFLASEPCSKVAPAKAQICQPDSNNSIGVCCLDDGPNHQN